MVEIGIVEIINMGGALGIIGSMFIVLYFSRKQAQGFTVDIETKIPMTWMKRFARWQKS
jgi:hypothetical protein